MGYYLDNAPSGITPDGRPLFRYVDDYGRLRQVVVAANGVPEFWNPQEPQARGTNTLAGAAAGSVVGAAIAGPLGAAVGGVLGAILARNV